MMKAILGKWNHWSDCSLHLAPAFEPEPCDCGNTDKQPFNALRNLAHFLHWRNEYRKGRT